MNVRQIQILLVLLVAVSMTGTVWCQEQLETPKKGFWVEKTKIDVGTVKAGSDAEAVFIFHNDTEKEVKILKAKPT